MTVQDTTHAELVLGIDPGSRYMGWAVLGSVGTRVQRVDSGVLAVVNESDLPQRLGRLLDELEGLFARFAVTALAIEAAFVKDNPRTALVLGQARGLPIALAARKGLPVHEYPPAVVKRRVAGSGRADKRQMQEMMRLLLEMDRLPAEDEADALAVAWAHLQTVGTFAQSAVARVQAASVAQDPRPRTAAQALYLDLVQQAGGSRRRR
jgi:crossover junction endodeoxyribonuclease RuvC